MMTSYYLIALFLSLSDSKITQLMLNTSEASRIRSLITDSTTHNISYYELPEFFSPLSNSGTSHATVLASNGDAVSTTGTINDL